MKKISFLFLPILLTFSSLTSACGGEHEESVITGFSILGGDSISGSLGASHFGFTGGIISILIIVSLILSIALLTKKLNLWR